jgi:tRNA-splicing endonuclease subunit Sen15
MAGELRLQPSAVTAFLHSQNVETDDLAQTHLVNLALQVQHNLLHQHQWRELKLHTSLDGGEQKLPRPLISGIPPTRLYVHPDEQVENINKEREATRKRVEAGELRGDADESTLDPEPEWVLPTHLREEWTLGKFAEVFDLVEAIPPGYDAVNFNMKWRSVKRFLLGIVQDDSTIVYYITHDGIVKPRQN